MNSKFKKVGLMAASLAVVASLAIGGTLAYLTDAEVAVNTFTVGDVQIELEELNYPGNDSDDVKDIVPNQEIAKDPRVDNHGTNDAVAFITVDSPMEKVSLVADDGTTAAQALQEIFWFKDAADELKDHANNFDATNFTELTAQEMYVKIAADGTETAVAAADLETTYDALQAGDMLVKRYVFGYNSELQGSTTHDGDAQTAANKVTATLFEKVQLKNVLENEIDDMVEKIQIRGYAIQADDIIAADGSTMSLPDDLNSIYEVYVRQNTASTNGNIASGKGVNGQYIEGIRNADSVASTSDGRATSDDPTHVDEHVNRWETNDDVTGAGDNVKPSNP